MVLAQALSPLSAFSRELPLRVQAAAAWTSGRAAIVRTVVEVPRSRASGDDWSKGGQVDATLLNAEGKPIAKGSAALDPGTFVAQIAITPTAPLEPGDYKVLIRTKGTAALGSTESFLFTLQADPLGTGTLFFRRFGPREIPTADQRFRRTERIVVETPASLGGDISARLLGRTGLPLNVPVTATIRDDADGTRWRRVEITLAPLAPGEYIVETTSKERVSTAFVCAVKTRGSLLICVTVEYSFFPCSFFVRAQASLRTEPHASIDGVAAECGRFAVRVLRRERSTGATARRDALSAANKTGSAKARPVCGSGGSAGGANNGGGATETVDKNERRPPPRDRLGPSDWHEQQCRDGFAARRFGCGTGAPELSRTDKALRTEIPIPL